MKNRTALAFLPVFCCTAACHNDGGRAASGETCTYKEMVIPAEVIRVERTGTNRYDAVFVLRRSGYASPAAADTIRYHAEKGTYLMEDQITEWGIQPGHAFKYLEKKRTSGDCKPRTGELTTERLR